MFIRNWLSIGALLFLGYCSWQVITGKAVIYGWKYYFYIFTSWGLLFASIKAWFRCFTWRRMIAAKNNVPDLSRGQNPKVKNRPRPGILEIACLLFFLLSLAAIWEICGQYHAAPHTALSIGFKAALSLVLRVVG